MILRITSKFCLTYDNNEADRKVFIREYTPGALCLDK